MNNHNHEVNSRAQHAKLIQERRNKRREEIFFENIRKLHEITENLLKEKEKEK